MPWLTIVVPVLNEASGVRPVLERLQPLRQRGAEVIVVDGGSEDGTAEHAAPYADRVILSERGRAIQMNAGARHSRGIHLLFLHADTVLPAQADTLIANALEVRGWGRFDVCIEGSAPMLRVIAFLMNVRSRMTRIATGDQAIFIRREWFETLSGFPIQPLMEDIEMSRRARQLGPPACLREKVKTSGRRWERHGIWRTIFLMWTLRLAYFLGVEPQALARAYGYLPASGARRSERLPCGD